jgi:hypothetical protein
MGGYADLHEAHLWTSEEGRPSRESGLIHRFAHPRYGCLPRSQTVGSVQPKGEMACRSIIGSSLTPRRARHRRPSALVALHVEGSRVATHPSHSDVTTPRRRPYSRSDGKSRRA